MIDLKSTHVYREIHEQPDVLARLLQGARGAAEALAAEIKRRDIQYVVVAARGTSDNAGRYAQYLLGSMNGLYVGLATPSLFTIYHAPPRFGNALVLGVSQSGKSPDIVAVLAEARRQGALTAAITNLPGSDLGQVADFVIDLHAEEEKAVAATKTYTAELAAIALLSTALTGDAEMARALDLVPGQVTQTLSMNSGLDCSAERYRYAQACVTIGRGFNYSTAFELSLKLKEMTYTVVEAVLQRRFPPRPVGGDCPGFPGHHHRAVRQDAA